MIFFSFLTFLLVCIMVAFRSFNREHRTPIAPITVIGTISRRPRNRARRPETERPESVPTTRQSVGGGTLKWNFAQVFDRYRRSGDWISSQVHSRPLARRTIPARINAR